MLPRVSQRSMIAYRERVIIKKVPAFSAKLRIYGFVSNKVALRVTLHTRRGGEGLGGRMCIHSTGYLLASPTAAEIWLGCCAL